MEQIINIEDKIIPMVMKTQISGITNVKEIFFEKRKPDEKDKPDEWVVTTEGSNLYGLFSHPLVDKKRTLCNNMWEIYEVFGIESARQFLIEEFMDVVTSDGTFVNSSHVELLVDLMTYTGSIISISRYGQKKVGSGPLSKASFEESLENFLKAGLNGEKETTDGVSASIMLGKLPKTGTGVFDIKIDTEKLIKNHKNVSFNKTTKEEKKDETKEETKEEKKEEIISIKSKKMKKVNSLCI
jgi:DNA-directed RNA polymerase II subunit RPB1